MTNEQLEKGNRLKREIESLIEFQKNLLLDKTKFEVVSKNQKLYVATIPEYFEEQVRKKLTELTLDMLFKLNDEFSKL